jgi:ATP-dependent DNA ligase
MLAKTFDSRIVVGKNSYVQRKYDGNRCIIGNVGDRIVAYSRNGKEIEGITHITDNIRLEEDQFVDGELYCHGESLQTIVSWIKRKQPGTVKLEYVMYDVISPLPFHERLQIVNSIRGKHCYSADTHKVSNEQKVMEYFETFRKEGYEGAILRVGENGYEDGKRSSSLLKIKAWVDSEFRVTDIQASKDGWAILVCQTYSGKLFTVSCHGTIEYKTTVLEQKELFIGSYVTVEYAYLTAEGIPFHPVAKNWR